MRFSYTISAALLGLAAFVQASNVVDLDTANFDSVRPFWRGADVRDADKLSMSVEASLPLLSCQ